MPLCILIEHTLIPHHYPPRRWPPETVDNWTMYDNHSLGQRRKVYGARIWAVGELARHELNRQHNTQGRLDHCTQKVKSMVSHEQRKNISMYWMSDWKCCASSQPKNSSMMSCQKLGITNHNKTSYLTIHCLEFNHITSKNQTFLQISFCDEMQSEKER